MTRTALVMTLCACLSIVGRGLADACTCARPGPPCQAAFTADAVFSGTVQSIEAVPDGGGFTSLRVSLDVERTFIGDVATTLEVVTAGDPAACGYRFAIGRAYLVYATKSADGAALGVSRCSRTRPLDEAAEDLKHLGSMPASGTGATIYGRLVEWRRHPAEGIDVDFGPLAGVPVLVRSASAFEQVATDRDGRYEVSGLRPDEFTVSVLPPFGFDRRSLEEQVTIADARSCAAVDFQLRQIARATGQVVGADGRGIAGAEVEAVAAELAGYGPLPYQRPVRTDASGRFAFDALPPGTYVFGVNLTRGRGPSTSGIAEYLPGTTDPSHAQVFDLAPGADVDVGVLRLTSRSR